MTRTSRALALAGAGAVALSLTVPTAALADDTASVSRGSASIQDPNPLYAGYTAELGKKKTISGTLTLPTLGDCSTDGGLLVAIELSDVTGGDYVDGGSYSSCFGGTKQHSLIIESAVMGQFVVGEGNDGDKIKVTQKVLSNGDVRVTLDNLSDPEFDAVTQDMSGSVIDVATSLHWGQIFVGGAPVPTLDYNKLGVKGVKIGGKDLKKAKPTKYDYVPSGDVVLKTSKIKKGTDYSTSNVS